MKEQAGIAIITVLVVLTLSGCGGGTGGGGGPPEKECTNEQDGDYPGCGVSKSTYSCNDPIAGKQFLWKYFPVIEPSDECDNDICHCSASGSQAAWEIQQGRVYTKRANAKGQGGHAGNGFGLHLVNVSAHWSTGGKTTAEVEEMFNQKLGSMNDFDSFMDFNVVFSTSGLQAYKEAFDKDHVPYYKGIWKSKGGKDWTSLIIQVPNTQMILELVQQTSLKYAAHDSMPEVIEQRLSAAAMRRYGARHPKTETPGNVSTTNPTGAIIKPLVVNRAASATSINKLDDFYVKGMGAKKTHDSGTTSDGIMKKCFQWSGATVDVCFTARPENKTKGDFKVETFENMLNTVHKNILGGHPRCGMDKWVDNHYAIDSRNSDSSRIVNYVNSNNVLHYCSTGGGPGSHKSASLHYVFDPTGWGIQLDLQFASAPSDCSSSMARQQKRLRSAGRGLLGAAGDYNPACTIDLTVCPSIHDVSSQVEEALV